MAGRKKREGPVNYFELPRKQLQSLCKKYGFPANKTNQLMAEFLTSHLNSDEYLNRDKSCPSPAVKTNFQFCDEEPATDDNLTAILESQPAVAETEVRRLSHEFMNVDATNTDRPLEASKAEGTGLGEGIQNGSEDMAGGLAQAMDFTTAKTDRPLEASKAESTGLGEGIQNGSEDMAGGFPLKESVDFTISAFRIREYRSKSDQDTSLPSSPAEESMDCKPEGSSPGSRTGFGPLPSSEYATDVTTAGLETQNTPLESQKSQGQETPLPLSIMPYVRDVTPDTSTLSSVGVKLFVDLKNDGLSPVENLRDYGAWRGQVQVRSNNTIQKEGMLGSLKTLEGSEVTRPVLETHPVSSLDRTDRAAEEGEMRNLLLQACMASTSSKRTDPAPLNSCVLTPTRKPSPLSVSFLCSKPIFPTSKSINGLVLDSAERSEIVKEWSAGDQSQEETLQPIDEISCSEEKTIANGELLLKKVDEKLLAKEPSELNRRTPKSIADLESPPDGIVEKVVKICEERRLSTAPVAIQRKDSYKASPFLKSSRIAAELERASKLGQTRRVGTLALKRAMGIAPLFVDTPHAEKEPPASESSSDGIVGSDANTSSTHVRSPGTMAIQVEGVQETTILPSDMDITTRSPSATEHLVSGDDFQDEVVAAQPTEEFTEKDEQTVVEMDTNGHKAEEAPVAEEAVNLPATVEESVTNLSWMTKPTQLSARRPVRHKLKEKPGRPFSANGRTLELMERASAKLKTLKKGTAGRGEAVPSRPTTSTTSADAEDLQIRGCAEHVEPTGELTMTEEAAAEEHPIARMEKATDESSPEQTSSLLEIVDDCSRQAEEGISSVVEDDPSKERVSESLIHNGTISISDDEELGFHDQSDTVESIPMETTTVFEASKSEETASEEPAAALSFLDIDFTKAAEVPLPENMFEIDATKAKERIAADKLIPSSPLDSSRQAMDAVVDSSPTPTTPTKPCGIRDVLSESEEKDNAYGFSLYGKENEWSKRQEQHKTPLTGRSKEKALRAAEKKASNLREQLLRKRRGMTEQLIDADDSPFESVQLSPLKVLATNTLL